MSDSETEEHLVKVLWATDDSYGFTKGLLICDIFLRVQFLSTLRKELCSQGQELREEDIIPPETDRFCGRCKPFNFISSKCLYLICIQF
jgi:hypothetical protein